MASQAVGENQVCCEVNSFIRGLHIYHDVWIAEVLLLTREPENVRDKYAVAVIRQVTGPRVNRGAGYGMEVPRILLQTLRTSKICKPCQRSHCKAAE